MSKCIDLDQYELHEAIAMVFAHYVYRKRCPAFEPDHSCTSCSNKQEETCWKDWLDGWSLRKPKRVTNYEYLRILTVDEMATFLSGMCKHHDNAPCREDIPSCEECWREWLNKEAKENG